MKVTNPLYDNQMFSHTFRNDRLYLKSPFMYSFVLNWYFQDASSWFLAFECFTGILGKSFGNHQGFLKGHKILFFNQYCKLTITGRTGLVHHATLSDMPPADEGCIIDACGSIKPPLDLRLHLKI